MLLITEEKMGTAWSNTMKFLMQCCPLMASLCNTHGDEFDWELACLWSRVCVFSLIRE